MEEGWHGLGSSPATKGGSGRRARRCKELVQGARPSFPMVKTPGNGRDRGGDPREWMGRGAEDARLSICGNRGQGGVLG